MPAFQKKYTQIPHILGVAAQRKTYVRVSYAKGAYYGKMDMNVRKIEGNEEGIQEENTVCLGT